MSASLRRRFEYCRPATTRPWRDGGSVLAPATPARRSYASTAGRASRTSSFRRGELGVHPSRREALAERDVVTIANGGIGDLQDVSDAFEATGCDAVMSSEGLLANPALFVRNRDADDAYVGARRLAREYLALAEDTGAETSDARGHLFKILHGGLTARVDLRTALSTALH